MKSERQIDARLERSVAPKNKLSEFERQQILTIVNEEQYAYLPPCKIVPLLADAGRYIASECPSNKPKQPKPVERINKAA